MRRDRAVPSPSAKYARRVQATRRAAPRKPSSQWPAVPRCPLELAQGLYGVPVAKESQNVTAIVLQDGKWDFTHTGTHTLAWDRSPHFLHGLANMRNVM